MRLALIKTSSMGDVIHALPVVTDIVRAIPGARIDWVVEESFAELPALHPSVGEVIPVAIRRWRKSLFDTGTRREIAAVRARLRAARYDLALDLQGLVKSAWVARMTGAPVAGFSRRCAREPLAALAYRRRFDVDMKLHAIERLRLLAAQALGYRVEGLPAFGLSPPDEPVPGLPERPYALLLHATSRAEKQWPDDRWRELIARLARQGLAAALPWGSAAERERAQSLAGAPPAVVLPKLTLRQCAAAIARAELVVGVDTGLTHLSAALDAPTVALFAATPAWRFGPYWTPRAESLGEDGRWPDVDAVLAAADRVRAAQAAGAQRG
ncbi:lipopolysaccharide heptosyltransferase I [Burkholderiaceae bacterium FT117]|uniref:lipopolysaccharide heptosyltransferase I n=1 Tax=Zeimonas sediminis TaxID=2944268 RepID=UPI002343089C|nr:lipopolysaccharide heptosyltransferase I [Zeimonas sediminis]MCM5572365.1 lipopolysaccharide heptosyltransferase I [Zeimonas sediminis]